MPWSHHPDDQPKCDECGAPGEWCDPSQDYRCDRCSPEPEPSEAERHDAFLQRMVDSEYWLTVNVAKVIHDLDCGVAVDLYGHGSPEHCAVVDAAGAKFQAVIDEARAAKVTRLAKLRSNDEAAVAEAA